MSHCRVFQGWTLLCAFIAVSALTAQAETVPVTVNLLVNLNGDSTDNFISSTSGGGVVQVWKDLAEDEISSEASRQDFGQSNTTRQPGLLANTPVPNSASTGLNYNVLDFDRSRSVSNTLNSATGSDTLKGKSAASARPTNYGDPFTSGTDGAYEATNASGLSWFTVFRSSDQSTIINNNSLPGGNGSGGTSRWGNQVPFDLTYATTATTGNNWIGTYLYDKPADADTQINLSTHVRNTANNEQHNDPATLTDSNILDPSTWYMMANSYDPVTGTLHTVLTKPNGSGGTTTIFDTTLTDAALVNGAGMGAGGAHVASALGTFTGSNGGTNDWAFDGLMAEVLVYDAALDATDFESIASYLNTKYFVSTTLPGDYNGDGFVDAADYVVWRKTNIDGDEGYNTWAENFGAGTGASIGLEATTIPEPSAIALSVFAIVGTITASRRRTAVGV